MPGIFSEKPVIFDSMKHYPVIIALITGLALSSCGKRVPEYVDSIPDDAVAVVSIHPMQIYEKGRLNTLRNLREKVKGQVWEQILEDPGSSGLMLDEYMYLFVKMEQEAPVIGLVSGLEDPDKFQSTLERIDEEIAGMLIETDDYTYVRPDEDAIISWSRDRMILLASPDADEFEPLYMTATLDTMYHPVKENSISSVTDFRNFLGKMKDLNFWVSSNDLAKMIERASDDSLRIDLPFMLSNNYARAYCEFEDGMMSVNGETHFSEEVQKNIEQVLVMNPSLSEPLLELAPAGDLLMAVAGSMDLKKIQRLVKRMDPGQLGEAGDRVELATGVPPEELIQAFTGDFAISVNGAREQTLLPLEIFIGFGVNNDSIQKKLMGRVENMAPVERQEDFFIINIQGNEIYSGIVDDVWVITNAKGYRDEVSDGRIEDPLPDSRFNEFADGSMGMFLNLDISAYPSMVRSAFSQNPQQKKWLEYMTSSFEYLGISAGNYETRAILETSKPDENSLYTILKMTDIPEQE